MVPLRDRAQGISQCKIAAQIELMEIGSAAPPIIRGEAANGLSGEIVGEEPGLHGAVAVHASKACRTVAIDIASSCGPQL